MPASGTVTVLFTDLVGSTEMIGRVGDEAGERVVSKHLLRLRDVLTSYGGEEVKKTGDGLMVAFTSAVRAIDCAIAIQQTIDWHNRNGDEEPVAVRVGLHAGEAFPEEGDYYGVSVVVANRLCDAAQPGQILTSDLVRGLLGSRGYELRRVDELSLKGIPEPVEAWEVPWERVLELPFESDARVLIVDDEPANVLLLQEILSQSGYRNIEATDDPRRALPLFISFDPDLVLLDLHMPHLDGFAVMEQLAGRVAPGDYKPILVLTADVTPEVKRKALARGARDFLTKPFDPTEVVLRIRNLLETRSLHLELRAEKGALEQKVDERTKQLQEAQLEILERLSRAAEIRDDQARGHTERVGEIAASIARALGLPPEQVELYRRAAPLHDIGKLAIPEDILAKPGPLTAEEFEVVKQHTVIGTRVLAGSRFPLLQLAEEIALTHHERWDGTGYAGLSGPGIPLSGRIVALADVFDVVTHDRPYARAWSREDALAEIERQSGRQFDPEVVGAFLGVVSTIGSESDAGGQPSSGGSGPARRTTGSPE